MIRNLILLLFVFGFLFSPLAQAQGAQELTVPSVVVSDQSQFITELNKEVEKQADLFFHEFAKNNPNEPIGLWLKAKNIAILKWRQLHHMSDLVKAAGPAPAYALIAGEVLSTCILPPIFVAMGMPSLAGASMGLPWGVFAGLGIASFQMAKLKVKIMRQLSIWSLSDLNRIRHELIGYEAKHRITTVILDEIKSGLSKTREFELVRSSKDIHPRMAKPAVSVAELEQIVRSSGEPGARYLERTYVAQVDVSLYAVKLLFFIMNDTLLMDSLNDLIFSRETTQEVSVERQRSREALIKVESLKQEVLGAIQSLEKEVALAKEKVKKGELSKAEYNAVVLQKKANIKLLHSQQLTLIQAEYGLLLQLKSALVRSEIGTTLAAIEQFETSVLLEARREILSLRTIVYDSQGLPVPHSMRLSCRELFAF